MNTSFKRLEPELAVAAQLSPDEVALLPAQGFRALICNRPDGEAEGQPSADIIAAAAREAGLEFRSVPVLGGAISDDDIARFAAALRELPSPILAYCRSGNRSTLLWALARAGSCPLEQLIERAHGAGYDLSPLLPRLQARDAAHKRDTH